mmetsp:Transcript_97635/g.134321  ORF Transcript_97635/g.134321 Transcript_97635/m.134321 type:complete len:147 (+) Transcript_97635:121-561(+)
MPGEHTPLKQSIEGTNENSDEAFTYSANSGSADANERHYLQNYDTISQATSLFSSRHFTPEEERKRTSSDLNTFFNYVKCLTGIGLPSLPYSVSKVGFYGAVFGIFLSLTINIYTSYLLVNARNRFRHVQIINFGDLAKHSMGTGM